MLQQSWVKEIAEKHKKTPAQVLLRYLVQRNIIVLPKSSTPSRIKENAEIFDFSLTEEEMTTLNSRGLHERQFTFVGMRYHPEYPFHDDF
ncbi:unnamed protein product [Echinostoma caproni]|uniref:NADP-dependent oxidoreductase domain-containing protein n=1 Tax=Echinostoma caproni TaxID=27848 RepID=A0A3P8H030_9TREM|nr:unnamed protein product [Echinostoma caproni]